MTKRVREAKVPVEVAVYAVNTKIITTLAYPLQVAIVKDTVMQQWERHLREAVRSAGHLPCHLPVEMYYLPVEERGLGMRSLEAEVKGARVKMDVQARNDVSYTKGTKGEPTVQAGVVEAAWRRYDRDPKPEHTKGKETMCAAVEEARRYMQVEVRLTEEGMRLEAVHEQDTNGGSRGRRERRGVHGWVDGARG